MNEDESQQTPEVVAQESEIDAFIATRKAAAEKTEKQHDQLAKAREAKAAKAAEKEPDEGGEVPGVEDGTELAAFVAAKKAGKDPVLKGKPKPEPKAVEAPEPTEEPAEEPAEAPEAKDDEDEPEAKEPEKHEPEDVKKQRAEDAKKFAALSRREKLVVDREKAAEVALKQAEEKAAVVERSAKQFVEQERARLAAKEREIDQWRQVIEKNRRSPRGLLEMAGFSVKDAVDEVVMDGPSTDVVSRDIQRQIDAIRQETAQQLAAERKARADAEAAVRQQQEEAAIASFRADVSSYIASNPDQSELITLYGDQDRVWRTIEQHFQAHGVIPDIKDAVEAVENDLYEKSQKLRSAKKFQSGEDPAAKTQAASPKQDTKTAGKAKTATTLTNTMVSTPRTETKGDPLLDMDPDEAMEELIKRHRRKRAG